MAIGKSCGYAYFTFYAMQHNVYKHHLKFLLIYPPQSFNCIPYICAQNFPEIANQIFKRNLPVLVRAYAADTSV